MPTLKDYIKKADFCNTCGTVDCFEHNNTTKREVLDTDTMAKDGLYLLQVDKEMYHCAQTGEHVSFGILSVFVHKNKYNKPNKYDYHY